MNSLSWIFLILRISVWIIFPVLRFWISTFVEGLCFLITWTSARWPYKFWSVYHGCLVIDKNYQIPNYDSIWGRFIFNFFQRLFILQQSLIFLYKRIIILDEFKYRFMEHGTWKKCCLHLTGRIIPHGLFGCYRTVGYLWSLVIQVKSYTNHFFLAFVQGHIYTF